MLSDVARNGHSLKGFKNNALALFSKQGIWILVLTNKKTNDNKVNLYKSLPD